MPLTFPTHEITKPLLAITTLLSMKMLIKQKHIGYSGHTGSTFQPKATHWHPQAGAQNQTP